MGFLKNLKMQFKAPRLKDPEFGDLIYMYISNNPSRSYWECMWNFPPTKTEIAIALDGDETGPKQESRKWHLDLVSRYKDILELSQPIIMSTLGEWKIDYKSEDLFNSVKLTGFGVDDPNAHPIKWEVSFETTGNRWLSITIPFVNNVAQEVIVDT
jgi:hypothetical protein